MKTKKRFRPLPFGTFEDKNNLFEIDKKMHEFPKYIMDQEILLIR
jgi:hypothetical protein